MTSEVQIFCTFDYVGMLTNPIDVKLFEGDKGLKSNQTAEHPKRGRPTIQINC